MRHFLKARAILFLAFAFGVCGCPSSLVAATVSWVGGSGDWNTATNWSTGALPGTNDDVVIGSGPSITVTHSSGTHTVNSVQSRQTFILSGGSLTISEGLQAGNFVTYSGGLLQTPTITVSNGASMIVSSGTLNAVTVNGTVDVGNSVNGGTLIVTNGLTLNGTLLLGNATNSNHGTLNFAGTQTLGGSSTVVFGTSPGNCLYTGVSAMTLTIAPGITVRGQSGTIGQAGNTSSSGMINEGTISCDVNGGTFTIGVTPFLNQSLVEGINGGGISFGSPWSNSGLIYEANGPLYWGNTGFGTNSGTILVSNAYVGSGIAVLTNSGTIAAASSCTFNSGGTISGGTITMSNGASMIVTEATLSGVTVNGTVDVGDSVNGGSLTVANGLTLNGTLLLGNPTNSNHGALGFAGTQTLGGSGKVVFGTSPGNSLYTGVSAMTLTIAPGITVRGQNGTIGQAGNSSSSGVINQGTIADDMLAGAININLQSFINRGTLSALASGASINCTAQPLTDYSTLNCANGSTIRWPGDLALNGNEIITSQPGGTVKIGGNLLGGTQNANKYAPQGTTEFLSGSHLLEAMSQDRGNVANGYVDNFAYGRILLDSGAQVTLEDQSANSAGPQPECVYATSVYVPSGATLNLNGLHLYARSSQIVGAVTNGAVSQATAGGPIAPNSLAGGSISTPGSSVGWTFLGRAGEHVTVIVDPGSANVVSPSLSYAFVQLFDPSMKPLAQTGNTVPGQIAALLDTPLSADGIYTVTVSAPASHPAATGNYLLTVWDSTPNVKSLVLNQQEQGQITTPYSADQWNFSGAAGQQVQFNLINESAQGLAFELSGPDGWIGFSNLDSGSGPLILPFDGAYTLTALGVGGSYGIDYAFEMESGAATNLTEGGTFNGTFVGNGQYQLLAVTVTNSGPLLITLNNTGAGNVTEMYVQFGTAPTRGTFGYASAAPNASSQRILIPNAIPGTYYVLIYGNYIATAGGYVVEVLDGAVFLTGVTPNTALYNANFTITLSGAGFLPSTSVALVSTNGASFLAAAVGVNSLTQITASFASNTLAAGFYSVAVAVPGSSAALTNALQILSSGAPNLTSSLTVPPIVRPGVAATAYSLYANTGNISMPAPLLVLTVEQNGVQGAFLGLDPALMGQGLWTSAQPLGFGHSAQFLGFGRLPGLLQPGESLSVPVYWAGWESPLGAHAIVNWNLGVLKADDPTPINWASLQSSTQPSSIPSDAWNGIFMALTNKVGSTWGAYVVMLDNNASYLGQLGQNVQDVSKLLAFEVMQADGLCPIQTLASSVDASVVTPGLPLTFSRSFGERISQRNAMGAYGRGWTHNWQYSLQQGGDGTITVFGPAGSQRIFQPDKRGGYFNQAGDYGTLAPDGSGGFTITEKTGLVYDYALSGTLNYVQDLNGNRISLEYSGGQLTSLTHSSGQYIQIAYNSAGLIQTVADQLGHQTILTYDGASQHLIGAQYFDGRTATYIYNTNGSATQLHAMTAASTSCCNWRYFTYDSLGRLSGTYLSDNAEALSLGYGVGGQVSVTDALTNSTQFYYDHRGLLCKTVDALGNPVSRAFDGSYNLVSITDPAGRSSNYGYDSLGNLLQTTDPLGNVSRFTYTTAYNRLASVTDAKENTTQYGYDSHGNLQSTTYANNSVESWTYDSFGDPATWVNRRGHQTIYTNNANGQITAKQFADGSLDTYQHDQFGNLTNTTTFDTNLNVLEPVSMTYDGSNHLTQILYPGGHFLAFTYDSNNRRTSSVDQLGHTLYYYYDEAGRLQRMTNEQNALVVQYQYNPAGRMAVKTLGNGIFTAYQYDPAGQLLNLTNFLANSNVISFFNYTYDSRGRRITMNSLDGTWTYTYDDLGQVIHAVLVSTTTNIPNQDLAYVYDALGNRTSTIENGVTTVYTANNLNQYVQVGNTNYTFDADGNVIQEVSTQAITTYIYNDENLIIALVSPHLTCAYIYDATKDRIGKVTNGLAMQYVVDAIGFGNVVAEYDSIGGLVARYDRGSDLLSRSDTSGNTTFYAFDGAGNVQQVLNAGGLAVNAYAYEPFGVLRQNVSDNSSEFQFMGKYGVIHEETGISFAWARYYSPTIGRWLEADPIGQLSGNNLYAYVGNNPVSFVDFIGLAPISPAPFSVLLPYSQSGGCSVCRGGPSLARPGIPPGVHPPSPPFQLPDDLDEDLKRRCEQGDALACCLRDWDECTKRPDVDVDDDDDGNSGTNSCPNCFPPNPCQLGANCSPGGGGSSQNIVPGDPNYLNGPAGFMTANYVIDSGLFDYEIFFENETNASAPAQIVQISNPLSTNLSWSTFQLREIAFGNTFIAIPPNVQHFQTNMPFSFAGVNFQVQIEAGINLATGQVFANFFSIDPTTGLPPSADTGFLPPEEGTGRGMGRVSYTIQPQPNLPEGLQIPNVAYIQFDENPIIATDQVNDDDPSQGISTNKMAIVTIDNSNPSSSVTSPYVSTNTAFTVCWSGTNNGPAVVSYDVYVSTNNGSWTLWLSQDTNTCEIFQGQVGNAYSFYSIAHDGAGRIQQAPSGTNAATIVAPNLPPQFAPLANQSVAPGQRLVITNLVQDPDTPIKFSLGTNAPAGASVSTNGVFAWTPSCAQASTTNLITVWATDSYSIPLSNSMSFVVTVSECLQVSVGSTVMQIGTTSSVPMSIVSTLGLTNLSFGVAYPTNRFTNWVMTSGNSAIGPITLQSGSAQTLVNLAAQPGQALTGPALLGNLSFFAVSNTSGFVPLIVTNVIGIKADGTVVGNSSGEPGRAVVIGAQPLLEASMGSNSQRLLTLYGNPGASYQLAYITNLSATNWTASWHTPMTNLSKVFSADSSRPQIFYRAWEFSANPPILEMSSFAPTNIVLLMYGQKGSNYVILSGSNLTNQGAWLPSTNTTLSNSFQFLNEPSPTNNIEFFRAKRQ